MGEELKNLRATVTIPAAPEKVYELLSNAGDLERWFCEQAEVKPGAGIYNFWGIHTPGTPFEDDLHAKLLDHDAPRSLTFEWDLRAAISTVRYELAAQGSGTLLTVTHRGLSKRATEEAAMHDFWYTALENLRLLAVTGRTQQMCDYRRKVGPTVEVAVDIHAAPADIFEKVVEPREIDRYFGNNSVVEPVPGGRFDYGWKEGGPLKVLEIEAPQKLVFSWRYDEPFDTVVTWSLAESGGRTRLSIVHSGFAEDFESEGYRSGWFSFLAIIKGMAELGPAWQMVDIQGLEHGDA